MCNKFLKLLAGEKAVAMAEFDVEDCFLNTPGTLVIPVLQFWLVFQFRNRRGTRYFAISKDGKALNSVGRPCSLHFWEVSSVMVLAIAEWELSQNSLFEVVEERGQMIVLQQGKGHLSAALVELVDLFREFTVQWPTCLLDKVSMRYRDNFFVALPCAEPISEENAAVELSALPFYAIQACVSG